MQLKTTNIGNVRTDGGSDDYVLIERQDADIDDLNELQDLLITKVYHDTDVPGAWYCHMVQVMRTQYSDNKVIAIIERRQNI